jgi:hypothetical protein
MTAAEILLLIETEGGYLNALPDGRLRWRLVSPELLEELRIHKEEIVSLLRERAKPKPNNHLISRADLVTAARLVTSDENLARAEDRARYRQQQECTPPVSTAYPQNKVRFAYKPRTDEQVERRIRQTKSNVEYEPLD